MLQEILGHANITTTLDPYGHLYPGDMDKYTDRLDDAATAAQEDTGTAKIRPEDEEDDPEESSSGRLPAETVARSEGLEPPTF